MGIFQVSLHSMNIYATVFIAEYVTFGHVTITRMQIAICWVPYLKISCNTIRNNACVLTYMGLTLSIGQFANAFILFEVTLKEIRACQEYQEEGNDML